MTMSSLLDLFDEFLLAKGGIAHLVERIEASPDALALLARSEHPALIREAKMLSLKGIPIVQAADVPSGYLRLRDAHRTLIGEFIVLADERAIFRVVGSET